MRATTGDSRQGRPCNKFKPTMAGLSEWQVVDDELEIGTAIAVEIRISPGAAVAIPSIT